jgi:hypothetical protein
VFETVKVGVFVVCTDPALGARSSVHSFLQCDADAYDLRSVSVPETDKQSRG